MKQTTLTSLSRGRLETFRACQRRFQLRYVERLPWPVAPPAESMNRAAQRGQAFHQLLAQHFLGLSLFPSDDEKVASWWQTFQRFIPNLPDGERLPEVSLTVPVGGQRLTGRFDLVIKSADHLYLYDWKTERKPRSAHLLKEDWQTKLYLFLAVAGSQALGGKVFRPEQVTLTYWFVEAPNQPITFRYDALEHDRHHQALQGIVEQLEHHLSDDDDKIWPLTDNHSYCQQCAYRIYCGRTDSNLEIDTEPVPEWWLSTEEEEVPQLIEPEWS